MFAMTTRWGATDDEVRADLPGDDVVPNPKIQTTYAISVSAGPDALWPWLAQLGQGRGGLYSYDWLENLIGCRIHTADRILPQFQSLAPGDEIRMGPEGYPFFRVVDAQPGKWLTMQAADPKTREPGTGSWSFVLREEPDATTRLLNRQRIDHGPDLMSIIAWKVITVPLGFLMAQRMLRTLKQRAEAARTAPPD